MKVSGVIPGQDRAPVLARKRAIVEAERTYIAHNGEVWHHTASGWHTLAPASPAKLLALYASDAANTEDWFHKQAAVLARELEAAMREVGLLREAA